MRFGAMALAVGLCAMALAETPALFTKGEFLTGCDLAPDNGRRP